MALERDGIGRRPTLRRGPAAVAALCALTLLVLLSVPVVAVAALIGVGSFLALARWPWLAVPAFAFLLFTNAAGVAVRSHGAPSAVGLAMVLLLGVPLLSDLSRHPRSLILPGSAVLMLVFLLVAILSTLLSEYPVDASREVRQLAVEGVLLFFFVVNVVNSRQRLGAAMWAVVLGGACVAAVTAVQFVTGTYERPYGGFGLIPLEYLSGFATSPRAAGPVGDPNYYAQILIIPLALAITMFRTQKWRLLQASLLGGIVLCGAALLLTFSRGAGLAFVAVVALMVVLRAVRLRYVALLVAALVVVVAAVPAYRDRISTLTSLGAATTPGGAAEVEDESIRSRTTEMLAATNVLADHPVVGVGLGLFPLYYQEYAGRIGLEVHEQTKWGSNRGEAPEREAHNLFLGLAAEAGLLGTLVFGALVVSVVRGLLWARRQTQIRQPEMAHWVTGLLLAVFGYLVAGLFLSLAYERYFWFLLALGAAATSIVKRDERRTDGTGSAPAGPRQQWTQENEGGAPAFGSSSLRCQDPELVQGNR